MEAKVNRLYLRTMPDREYISTKLKKDHHVTDIDFPWEQLLKDKGYSITTSHRFLM